MNAFSTIQMRESRARHHSAITDINAVYLRLCIPIPVSSCSVIIKETNTILLSVCYYQEYKYCTHNQSLLISMIQILFFYQFVIINDTNLYCTTINMLPSMIQILYSYQSLLLLMIHILSISLHINYANTVPLPISVNTLI